MSWYYSAAQGTVFEATGVQKWAVDRQIQIESVDPIPGKSIYGPYTTRAEAEAQKTATPPSGIGFGLGIPSITSGLSATVAAAIVRIAEVALGIVLLAVAANIILKSTTGIDVAGSAGRAAKTGAKVAAVA